MLTVLDPTNEVPFYVYLQFVFLSCFCTLYDLKNYKKIIRRSGSDSCGHKYMSSTWDLGLGLFLLQNCI